MTEIIDINSRRNLKRGISEEELDAKVRKLEQSAEDSGRTGLQKLRTCSPVPPRDRHTIALALGRELERAKRVLKVRSADLPMAKQHAYATPVAFQKVLSRLHVSDAKSSRSKHSRLPRLDANGGRYADLIESIAEVTGQNLVLLADRVLRGTKFSLSDPSHLAIRMVGTMADAVQRFDREFGWLTTYNEIAAAHRYLLDHGIMVAFPSEYSCPDEADKAAASHRLSKALGVPPSQIFREFALSL